MNNEVQVYFVTDEYMKSNYVKTLAYEWIENLIYFLCFYPIVAIINYSIYKNENMLYFNLITIIPIFIMTYLRMKIKTKRNFTLGIVLVIAISLITIGFALKQYVFMVFLVIWAIDCIKRSKSMQRVRFNIDKFFIVEALLIPQIIIAATSDIKTFQVFISIIGIIIMLVSVGYVCKARNVRLSMDDEENKSFNKKDSNIFIAGILIFITIIMFLLYIFGAFEAAYALTRRIANRFFGVFNGMWLQQFTNDTPPPQDAPKDNSVDMIKNILNQDSHHSKFVEFILSIIKMTLNIAFNIIFIAVVVGVSYMIINRILIYIKKLRNEDKVTFVFTSNKEYEIKEKINKAKFNVGKSIFLNDKEKIRRLYKNKILKYKKNNVKVNNFFSTADIKREILSKAYDNIEAETRIYEKARYSNEEITKKDIEILENKKKK